MSLLKALQRKSRNTTLIINFINEYLVELKLENVNFKNNYKTLLSVFNMLSRSEDFKVNINLECGNWYCEIKYKNIESFRFSNNLNRALYYSLIDFIKKINNENKRNQRTN